MAESGTIPILKYFLERAEDVEVKSIIQMALEYSEKHLLELTAIFKSEDYPVPIGFSESDVNLNAPRLFSDTYALYFIRNLSKVGMAAHGASLSSAARKDIRTLYTNYINDAIKVG